MLLQWQPADSMAGIPREYHNFGDHLPWLFESFFVPSEWTNLLNDQVNSYSLIGSMLCDTIINEALAKGYTPHYLGCGYRGHEISPEVAARAKFYGCRGTFSQQALRAVGQEVEVTGDPAALVPLIFPKPQLHRQKLLVPHLVDPCVATCDLRQHGCDRLIIPMTTNTEHLAQMVQDIAGANFVLAGAMHAAIVAHAYGIPFAFFDVGYRNCAGKWEDWGSSIGLQPSQIVFVQNVKDGREWYASIQKNIRPMLTLPILRQANHIKSIRSDWWVKASMLDAKNCGLSAVS